MNVTRKIIVRAASKHYSVYYGRGELRQISKRLLTLGATTGTFVLSSPKVWKRWGKSLLTTLGRKSNPDVILFDDREAAKNLATVEKLCRTLARAGADRRCTIIDAGGGVVGDVAGFVAATYLRGVRLVHVPTTLVAQVDSAIGGKTGVDLPEGKNMVGAFYQPDLVIADPEVLKTLPGREYRSGIYEVIKYGVIGDRALLAQLERDMDKLLRRDAATLDAIIPRCAAAKARITSLDERESGPRESLNFGHTIGHALESITKYRVFLHGEAVAWGMIAATLLSVAAARLPLADAARIIGLVRRVGTLPPLPHIPPKSLVAAMRCDKKTRDGRLRFVLAKRIGKVQIGSELPDDLIADVWRELLGLAKTAE
ncbi:MAG TPA: 3-dehydroquinate synthase [Candidatus Acidoferrales bacterium]|nr:3-dehydroquinate synthase [Candidatus Acidoferrales bacterium]